MSSLGGTEHNSNEENSSSSSAKPIEIKTESFPPDAVEMSHVKIRKEITWLFILSFFVVFLLQWASTMYLAHNRPNSLDEMDKVFNMWVPSFTTLLGTAVGFYFGERRR